MGFKFFELLLNEFSVCDGVLFIMFEEQLALSRVVKFRDFTQIFEEVVEESHSDKDELIWVISEFFGWDGGDEAAGPPEEEFFPQEDKLMVVSSDLERASGIPTGDSIGGFFIESCGLFTGLVDSELNLGLF